VYSHAAALFFERGIAKRESKEFASLCVDASEGSFGFELLLCPGEGKNAKVFCCPKLEGLEGSEKARCGKGTS